MIAVHFSPEGADAMPFFLGLLTTIGVVLAAVVSVACTDYYLHSFCMLFIVPVGGIIAGMGCASGIFLGLFISEKRQSFCDYLLAVQLAGLGFFGVYYTLYSATYIGPDQTVNYQFEGRHISQITNPDTHLPFTFASFVAHDVLNRESTLFIGAGREGRGIHGSFQTKPILKWIDFGLEGLGFLVGGLSVGFLILQDKRYCESCQRYFKELWLFSVDPIEYKDVSIELEDYLDSGEDLANYIAIKQPNSNGLPSHRYRFELSYCPCCYEGLILIKAMEPDGDGCLQENPLHRRTIALTPEVIEDALNVNNAQACEYQPACGDVTAAQIHA